MAGQYALLEVRRTIRCPLVKAPLRFTPTIRKVIRVFLLEMVIENLGVPLTLQITRQIKEKAASVFG